MTYADQSALWASSDERRPVVKRGALLATFDPPQLWWNDRPVPLSPKEAALMTLMMRKGRLCWDEVDTTLGCSRDTRAVLIHRIRRKVAELGGADPVETVRKWGLRLRIEADFAQSRAIWIGADESTIGQMTPPRPTPARSEIARSNNGAGYALV